MPIPTTASRAVFRGNPVETVLDRVALATSVETATGVAASIIATRSPRATRLEVGSGAIAIVRTNDVVLARL
jgi:molybdopterin-binding protein